MIVMHATHRKKAEVKKSLIWNFHSGKICEDLQMCSEEDAIEKFLNFKLEQNTSVVIETPFSTGALSMQNIFHYIVFRWQLDYLGKTWKKESSIKKIFRAYSAKKKHFTIRFSKFPFFSDLIVQARKNRLVQRSHKIPGP